VPEPLRVLRILGRCNLGGPARQLRALRPELERRGVRELLVSGLLEEGETALDTGHEILGIEEALRRGPEASGRVRLPCLGRTPRPGGDLRALWILSRLVRSFRPRILHSHTWKAGLIAALLPRGPERAARVHHWHGHVFEGYGNPTASALLRAGERRLKRRRDLVCCVSESCRRELRALGLLGPGRVEVLPPAVPAPDRILFHGEGGAGAGAPDRSPGPGSGLRRALRRRLGLPERAFVPVFLGRFVEIKAPLLFVDCLRALLDRGIEVRALAFGAGPLEGRMQAAAEGLPLAFPGPDPGAPDLLPAADVCVLPSRREGLPLAAVEALMRGIPVVGRRVPGLVDLEGPGVTLVPPGREDRLGEDLAEACLRAPEVPPALQRTLRLRHDPARIAGRLLALYRGLCGAVPGKERRRAR